MTLNNINLVIVGPRSRSPNLGTRKDTRTRLEDRHRSDYRPDRLFLRGQRAVNETSYQGRSVRPPFTASSLPNLTPPRRLIEEGGDWDRRNRLKVYTGLHAISIRQFSRAATLFIDALSTFTASELLPYNDFVGMTVVAGALTLGRVGLKKKVGLSALAIFLGFFYNPALQPCSPNVQPFNVPPTDYLLPSNSSTFQHLPQIHQY